MTRALLLPTVRRSVGKERPAPLDDALAARHPETPIAEIPLTERERRAQLALLRRQIGFRRWRRLEFLRTVGSADKDGYL